MNEASSLPSATERLERGDASLTSIDLRGKGRGCTEGSDDAVPRAKIATFVAALKRRCRPLPGLQPSANCKLSHLALHNHFLDPSELPLLFDALPHISTLDTLVLFFHDVGDEGVGMLMQALTGSARCGVANEEHYCNYEGITSMTPRASAGGLKELYLSHCNISCRGATSIARALDHSSSNDPRRSGNMLGRLQVLSLGSNRIEQEGATSLAEAFGRYPSLQRLVLHGNQALKQPTSRTQDAKDELVAPIYCHALLPAGWQSPQVNPSSTSDLKESTPTPLAMSIFAPLILPHIQRRWEKDLVLVRPHDELRRRLREEMYRKDSTFVDAHLECMPDILGWMGREGGCCRQTNLHSRSISVRGKCIPHSGGAEYCRACAAIHLNDLHELLLRMPHLIALFRCLPTETTVSEESLDVQGLGTQVLRLAL
ncbi:hypothetical protein ACHAXT_000914 [Thalassiosira profunda]